MTLYLYDKRKINNAEYQKKSPIDAINYVSDKPVTKEN